jgi:hypothetical protein
MDDDFFTFGVTDPKGSLDDTRGMIDDPRPHIYRRDGALARLRGLTTTAAVAGVAGTAVFGAVAAVSWSGDPAAKSATDLGAAVTPNDPGTTRQQPQQTAPDPNSIFGTNPFGGSSGQSNSSGSTRVRSSSGGRSHATTGGSG